MLNKNCVFDAEGIDVESKRETMIADRAALLRRCSHGLRRERHDIE